MKCPLLCFLLFVFLSGKAETNINANYYFSGVSGLSQVNVKSILQDSYGFMWFGTRNRLNRYNGTGMKIFDCYDPVLRKGNNNISTLFEDKDKKMWVGTDKGIFIFDPVYETFSFFNDDASGKIKIEDWVADIREDSDNNIWIVIPNQGLFRYYTPAKQLFHYSIGGTELPDQGNPQCICIEPNGMVWIGTNGGGVYLYNKNADSFTQYLGDNNGGSLKNENIYTLCNYGDELVLGIHEGRLRKLNKRKNTLTDVDAPEVHYKIIRHVVNMNDELWVGTQAGLFIVNELKNSVIHLSEDPMYPYALSDNVVEKIYKDREGGIWVATRFGGVNYLSNKGISFEYYVPLSSKNSIASRRLREMKEDAAGNIWIGSENAGLIIFNPKKNEFKTMDINVNNNKLILGLSLDENRALIGLFKNGLDVIQLPRLKIRHYSGADLNLNEASIYAICEDRYGKIWIGNGWGISRGDKDMKNFKWIDKFGLNYIYGIMEDSNGFIWVATMGNGVYKYNQETEQITHYQYDINNPLSLSSNSVSDVTETSLGEIWFSTDRGGICRYNRETDNFTSFSVGDGFPDDVAYKIVEDKQHNLWFGTNNGLVKFNPLTKEVKIFSKKNGLPFNEFNYKSALVGRNGKLYFGGLNGLIAFDPNSFEENKFIPPVYVTQLTIYNKKIDLNTEKSPLKKAINHSRKITLNYNQSNIGFDFVALSYTAPQANRYAYKMEGIDKDWTYTNDNHTASYAKLPPGQYVFGVKGSNNDGQCNPEGTFIEIEILPPWWWSKIAVVFYVVCAGLCLYYFLNRYVRKTNKRHEEKRHLFETEKEKELYSAKLTFFTNIAHEIRTPITLINGPLESMMEMEIEDPEIKKSLAIMSKNTAELLNLINQLLDFRKVDSNKLVLTFSVNNVTNILKEVYSRFEPTASRRNKSMQMSLPADDIYVPLDKDALIKILNNLFSNALRYSDQAIEIELTSDDSFLFINIRNDGDIVPEEQREKIFDPFYQVNRRQGTNSGSGIGLSLARSLAELHNGYLYFEKKEEMNEFTVKLPLTQNEILKKEIPGNDYVLEESDSKNERQNAEILLLVEDNAEMLSFIAGQLRKQFAVEKAANGIEALKTLEEKNIDLVLSDIMMPEMDGFELCKNIKNNLDYSHIPVVLLTAKNDMDSKIHGLEMGADAYVEKPFSMSHLIAQLTTLLNNRRREKEAFIRKPFLSVQSMGMNKADEQFIRKIIDLIHENITKPEFNVENLSDRLFMSRSNLHRKIKALTGLTPIDFIRLIRLKKAAELIRSGKHRVGEVCYLVGINSSSYFIKLFQKQFGTTPKEFEKQL